MLQIETNICTVKKGKKLIYLVHVRYNQEYSEEEKKKKGKINLSLLKKKTSKCMHVFVY